MKHPVLTHDLDPGKAAEYERAVSRVMAMSEAEMLRLVPTRSAIAICGCANCEGGAQEWAPKQFDWSIDRPFELKCRFCGHVYPSDRYPMDRTETGVNALGETVTYRYYFDEKRGRDFWFEACADYFRRDWFVRQCLALARAYHVTRKAEYARRAALILDRFAQAYPHMAVLSQWPQRRREIVKPTPPYPETGGKWGRWISDEVPRYLPEAYDLIHDSPELDRLTHEQGTDIRRRIEDDFFRATVAYLLTLGKEPTGPHLGNMGPFYTQTMIQIGRVIDEPAYVHWGYRWVRNILGERFFYDGMWCESPAYHYQALNGIRMVLAALKGYSDPPGYRDPGGGRVPAERVDAHWRERSERQRRGPGPGPRLENLDLERELPFLQKAQRAPDRIAYPDGRVCPVHDTWAGKISSPARERSVSTLLPGFGHASLGAGRGANQIQAQLHFSGGHGHEHADSLNVSLFARGSELLSDLGYTHTKLRHWTSCTMSHNTVAIDRQNQSTRDSDGDLLRFVPDLDGVAVVEARGARAYPGLAQVYRRELLLIGVSEVDFYVVDLFRVCGGHIHDWLLHGSADDEMTADCSFPLAPHPGTLLEAGEAWTEPVGNYSVYSPYGLMRDIRQGKTTGPFDVTFRYAPQAPGATETARRGGGVRVHLLGDTATEVFLTRTPRVRAAGENDQKVYDAWMPQLVARRRGTAPLASLFAAIHEPFGTAPFLQSVRRMGTGTRGRRALAAEPTAPGAGPRGRQGAATESGVALEVRHGDVTDTIISTDDTAPYPLRRLPNGLSLRGRLAVVREKAGRVIAAWLVEGERVTKGDFTLKCDHPSYEGVIESAQRAADGAAADAFVTGAALPEGNELAGRWMIVTHGNGSTHGYEIRRVERHAGKSMILLGDDHGLKIRGDQTEECYYPRRTIAGRNRFSIAGQAVWKNGVRREGSPDPGVPGR
jgi:hypothetical protein